MFSLNKKRTNMWNSESRETDDIKSIFHEKSYNLLYSLTSSWEDQSKDF